ncbi:MAG: hypothetical protein FRX49_01136 [Trebouxia sp. A1-2]|nr:MAG: hypothetical protein FRX49_01136 [Trebouxia sp. A1-2]
MLSHAVQQVMMLQMTIGHVTKEARAQSASNIRSRQPGVSQKPRESASLNLGRQIALCSTVQAACTSFSSKASSLHTQSISKRLQGHGPLAGALLKSYGGAHPLRSHHNLQSLSLWNTHRMNRAVNGHMVG